MCIHKEMESSKSYLMHDLFLNVIVVAHVNFFAAYQHFIEVTRACEHVRHYV